MNANSKKSAQYEVTIDGVTYPSLSSAAELMGYSIGGLKYRIDRGLDCHGMEMTAREIVRNVNNVKVVCVETGKVYDSIKKAADDHFLTSQSIGRACTEGHKAGGYHWQRVGNGQTENTYLQKLLDKEKAIQNGLKMSKPGPHRNDLLRALTKVQRRIAKCRKGAAS